MGPAGMKLINRKKADTLRVIYQSFSGTLNLQEATLHAMNDNCKYILLLYI